MSGDESAVIQEDKAAPQETVGLAHQEQDLLDPPLSLNSHSSLPELITMTSPSSTGSMSALK
jgi:hypothetical protein